MKTIKEQLLSNSYEYLRTLPNFDKIREELDKLETFMFKCADKGSLGINVTVNPWTKGYSDFNHSHFQTEFINDDVL